MGKAPENKGAHTYNKLKRDTYISRDDALKKLHISEEGFRKLVILKGIYPREPTKVKQRNKARKKGVKGLDPKRLMYYSLKDINFLRHERILHQMEELKLLERKLKDSMNKGNAGKIVHLHKYRPFITFDHLIKERYPTFYSALADMDDCLTLMFLFTKVSQSELISTKEIKNINRLCNEFMTVVTKTKSLKKTFLTIKGVYYQLEILGQTITWVIPYDFPQKIPTEIDFSIFKTYLAFYQTLMTFINFKLFHMNNLAYPIVETSTEQDNIDNKGLIAVESFLLPVKAKTLENTDRLNKDKKSESDEEESDEESGEESGEEEESESEEETEERLKTISLKDIAKKDLQHSKDDDNDSEEETEEQNDEKDDSLEAEMKEKNLFKGMVFVVSRECSSTHCEFVIKSRGGTLLKEVSQDGSMAFNSRVTHHIMDRPRLPRVYESVKDSREFVQPQWLFDCVNVGVLIPLEKYVLGSKLPPHLSPFVDYDKEPYVPEYAKELQLLRTKGMIDMKEEVEGAVKVDTKRIKEKERRKEEARYQQELQAEIRGEKFSEQSKKSRESSNSSEEEEEEEIQDEERQLKETMMSRKNYKMYKRKRMQDKKKIERISNLNKKRKTVKK